MGSISRYSSLDRFQEAFGEKIKAHYEKQILGLTVTDMSELTLDYYKSADITLSDGNILTVHFGWTSEEEEFEGKEILDEDEISNEEYFNHYLKDKKITKVETGYERDDEFYCFAFVDDESGVLEIPIGFDPETCELHNFDIITEEEFIEFQKSN